MRSNIEGVAFVLLLGLGGCGSNRASPAADGAAPAPTDAAATARTYAASACGSCVGQQCSTAISACSGDPDCANYLTCLDACGVGPTGDVDPSCEAACPRGSSSAGAQAEATLTQCRTMGAGATCAGCGFDAGAGDPLVNQVCTPSTDPRPCARCEKSFCCDSVANCAANPDCYPFDDCVVACENGLPDDAGFHDGAPPDGGYLACDNYCLQAHPTGLTDLAPLSVCDLFHCSTACGGAMDPCLTCKTTRCAHEYVAFASTPDGFLLTDCAGCGDTSCIAPCEEAYPKAKAAFEAFLTCIAGKCAGPCGQ